MKRIILICVSVIMTMCAYAQAPNKMSYQAVIRNSSNALVTNKPIGMKISILQNSPSGTAVYAETQTPTSNENGLVSIEIGGGKLVSGNFSTINWANGPFYVKTEIDPAGGTNYAITGVSQLLSVPYALYAEKVNPSSLNTGFLFHSTGNLEEANQTYVNKYSMGYLNPTPANYRVYSFMIPRNGQIKYLLVTPTQNSLAVGSVVTVKVLLNGVPTSLSLTLTSADGFKLKANKSDVIDVVEGDFIAIQYSETGGVAPGTYFQSVVEFK